MDKVIDNIHELFIEEARKSPLLFNDLASMENYISESYSGRSLIELLQNADDAQSEKLLVKKQSDFVFIVEMMDAHLPGRIYWRYVGVVLLLRSEMLIQLDIGE